MAQEKRPQVYPLLPQEGAWKDSGKVPVSGSPEVISMQPVITVDNSRPTERPNATTEATAKAGAYGGAELGSVLGNSICCCCGGIIGTCIGEKYGEKAVKRAGLQEGAGKLRDNLGNVIGERNVDKAGEIALTAFGYGDDQFCACCPCMPSSQILFFIMVAFYVYNWYRLAIGISYESGCTESALMIKTENVSRIVNNGTNNATEEFLDTGNSSTWEVVLDEYPCEFAFQYMIAGSIVWLLYLPFYIVTLLGNCWRQCCCCLCDPLVCFATICDFMKRCLCECGKFSCINLFWYSMCIFQVIWGCCGLYWLVDITYFEKDGENFKSYVDPTNKFLDNVLASVILDILLAGSELFHKILHYVRTTRMENQDQQEDHEAGEGGTNTCDY